MTLQVLQRGEWYGRPRKMADTFIVKKGSRVATCELWSHQFGWELRLVIAGDELPRTQVCRTQDEVLDCFEGWKAALLEKGWA